MSFSADRTAASTWWTYDRADDDTLGLAVRERVVKRRHTRRRERVVPIAHIDRHEDDPVSSYQVSIEAGVAGQLARLPETKMSLTMVLPGVSPRPRP